MSSKWEHFPFSVVYSGRIMVLCFFCQLVKNTMVPTVELSPQGSSTSAFYRQRQPWKMAHVSNACPTSSHGNAFCITRSRRNPRSRCAWLIGPEPRWGYARTSFGVDAAAEVTISKCNLWKSWTLELTSEFSQAHLTIFSTVWDAGWFHQDHASRVNAKPQKIYQYFVG